MGLDIPGSAQNPARIVVDYGKGNRHGIAVDPSLLPTLDVSLSGAVEKPGLGITSNVAGATMVINGIVVKHPISGTFKSVLLPPGAYAVKLVHDGYQDSTEQRVVLKVGDIGLKRLSFELIPVVAKATLAIGGTPKPPC